MLAKLYKYTRSLSQPIVEESDQNPKSNSILIATMPNFTSSDKDNFTIYLTLLAVCIRFPNGSAYLL